MCENAKEKGKIGMGRPREKGMGSGVREKRDTQVQRQTEYYVRCRGQSGG